VCYALAEEAVSGWVVERAGAAPGLLVLGRQRLLRPDEPEFGDYGVVYVRGARPAGAARRSGAAC
jgi:hypothetical protein